MPPMTILDAAAMPPGAGCQEGELLARMLHLLEQRMDKLEGELPDQIEAAVQRAMAAHVLTPEQRQWVELAIQREAQSIRLRQAVIEKTLAGLVWMSVVGVGMAVWEYVRAHVGAPKP